MQGKMQMDSLKIGRGFKVLPTEFADLRAEIQNVTNPFEPSFNFESLVRVLE